MGGDARRVLCSAFEDFGDSMAYLRTGAPGYTISQLENMLQARRSQLGELFRERAKALKVLGGIDDRIRRLGGNLKGSGGGSINVNAGGRARNPKSLVATMEHVLEKSGKPMSVSEILDAILSTGYRSNANNFRAIVNQTLIKERKRFANTGRAMYAIKK
jgi:hypothetical protein